MKKVLALVLAVQLTLLPFAFAQAQDKPVAALGRVASLGEVSEAQKSIITNRLEGILSKSYDLVSQEQYLKAEQAAFDALDLEKCTEEECIRKIQEILQVERLFLLQIIREADFTQLTLNLVRLDSKRVVEGVCEKCSIGQLYERIEELAQELISQDIRESAQELVAGQPAGPLPQAQPEEEGGFPWWGWALIGVGVAALAAGSSSSSSDSGSSGETGSATYTW